MTTATTEATSQDLRVSEQYRRNAEERQRLLDLAGEAITNYLRAQHAAGVEQSHGVVDQVAMETGLPVSLVQQKLFSMDNAGRVRLTTTGTSLVDGA